MWNHKNRVHRIVRRKQFTRRVVPLIEPFESRLLLSIDIGPTQLTLSTTPLPTSATVGTSIADQATVIGGDNPTGTVTFNLYNNSTGSGTALFTDIEPLSGGTATSAGYTATAAGTDYWVATYNGDTYNSPVTSGTAAEPVTVIPAIPAINTSQLPPSATVGSSIADQATVIGGDNPTGTVTFNLYNNSTGSGTPLFTDANVPLSSSGVASSTGYTATATGTDYWVVTYNGDSNNASVSSGTALEPVTVTPATPTINTSQQPASATVGSLIADQATVSGGYNATGTVTFKLYSNSTGSGTPLFTDANAALVSGVATSTGYTATATGTDYWVATYNGNSNNATVSSGTAVEPVTVTPATPTINTTQQPASATVGTSIADQATDSGGYNATGTVTFNLYSNSTGSGTPLFTDANVALVSGVATSTGYTATATGTDYWVATYNGNSNNATVSSGTAVEPVTVTPATPGITTTPGGTVAIGSFVISGTKYLDTTGNGFSSDDTPQSGVTINLYEQTNNSGGLQVGSGGDTFVTSTTTMSNGTYSFTLTSPGTYYVQESVPSGYIQTGGGPDGSAGNTYYTINATSGQDYSGNNFDDYLIPNCCSASVSFKVTTPGGSSQTVTNLSGNTAQGDTVTATITNAPANQDFTLVSYIAPSSSFSDSNAYQQEIYQQANGTYSSGTLTLKVTIPCSYYQIDFVCGAAIGQLEPNQNNDAYGPDSANILYHAQDRFTSGDNGGTTAPNPMPTGTSPTPLTPPSIPAPPLTLTDSATLSGGNNPTGTITFTLYNPSNSAVYTDVVTVSGNGTYSTSMGNNPGGYTPTVAGTYEWVAVYSGNNNNSRVTSPSGNEPETVSKASPTISTRTGGSVTIGCNTKLTDSATLSGGYNPTGTITFDLYAPGVTPSGNNYVYTDPVTVNNGNASSGSYTPPTTGTFEWVAVYSGDTNNASVTSPFNSEPESVSASPVGCGQFGTTGFWQNCNTGQQLICQLNGGGSKGSCTSLGNWLATNYPHLYGSSCDKSNSCVTNLAGCTNTQVASFYQTLCNKNMSYAQVMAGALASYATNSSLAGGSYAQSFGFVMEPGGNGLGTYNVRSYGSCLGLSNNTSYSVLNLLSATDSLASQGTSKLTSNLGGVNTIFYGINATGNVTNASLGNASLAYTPAQIRGAYGINDLTLDGSGQTIAIVNAYNNPAICQSLDTFDTQFGLTTLGPSLYQQYGPASSFLTVMNQNGQTTSLPLTDPSGVGTENWELEAALDVEWTHAIAPGAQIVLVEANSQSLSDLMASVATAASQPGVSVVTMSWGFPEGQAVSAAAEANYDNVFNVPGVTFLASTGDYGTADPEYPAFSPNVVAVGGTSLTLNADQSYNSETGWGYYSDSVGAAIGSGGGISMYESEPAYQQGVQSTGLRTTPDVSLVADPATGAWVADTYNLGTSNPFEVAGGTSLSAPAFAGLILLANEGRVASGEATLNSVTPTDTQQALYMLPQSDYNSITSGTNGYSANAGYNLVTGLGTPVANLMVPDLIAYQGPGTTYAGPTVSPLQDATLYSNWANGGGTTNAMNAFNVFSALTATGSGFSGVQSPTASLAMGREAGVTQAPTPSLVNLTPTVAATTTQSAAIGSTFGVSIGSISLHGSAQSLGSISNSTGAGMTSAPLLGVSSSSFSTGLVAHMPAWSTPGHAVSSPSALEHQAVFSGLDRPNLYYTDAFVLARPRGELAADWVLDDMAANLLLSRGQDGAAPVSVLALPPTGVTVALDAAGLEQNVPSAASAAGLVVFGLAAGLWARRAGTLDTRKRQSGSRPSRGKSLDLTPGNEAW